MLIVNVHRNDEYICVSSEEKQQDMSLSISTNGNASITVSVEVNGTIYSGVFCNIIEYNIYIGCDQKVMTFRVPLGTLFAQKSGGAPGPATSAAIASASSAGTSTSFGFSTPQAQTLSPASSSSSSSKGPGLAEPANNGSP